MSLLYYTYILRCADHTYYTGVTNDVDLRVEQHNSLDYPSSYCHKRRPVELVFVDQFNNPREAIDFEKQIKRWSRVKKEALIKGDFNCLHDLAKCKNKTTHVLFRKDKI